MNILNEACEPFRLKLYINATCSGEKIQLNLNNTKTTRLGHMQRCAHFIVGFPCKEARL